MASGLEDNVADYYQQQVEMLEGFNEMDALAERGFIPGMSKVHTIIAIFNSLSFYLFTFGSGAEDHNRAIVMVSGRAREVG